jgi:hypothetical protein
VRSNLTEEYLIVRQGILRARKKEIWKFGIDVGDGGKGREW